MQRGGKPMIDYTIGDKVVCLFTEDTDFRAILEHNLKNFEYAIVGQIYTVRDMCAAGELMSCDSPGVLLHEISGGIDNEGAEWWFDATAFRKALPHELNIQRIVEVIE